MRSKFSLSKTLWDLLMWFLAWSIFFIIKYLGTADLPAFDRVLSLSFQNMFTNTLMISVFIALPYSIFDQLLDRTKMYKRSYFFIIAVKSLVQLIITFLSFFLLINIIRHYSDLQEYTDIDEIYKSILFSDFTLLILFYSLLASTLIHVFQLFDKKIGRRVIINLLLGRYNSPREEKRIFMFLDLKSSTTHAENLGHLMFSSLIQDCFDDLTEAIVKHNVEVYQYVGDEAVLTWKIKDGLKSNNCLKTYFTFQSKLDRRKEYYEKKYAIQPFFKAGVHFGIVTVTEVGVIKREIAYHSDVLNTAARIQSKCNEFNAPLLISEDLFKTLENKEEFDFNSIGGINLRGKQALVNIYSCFEK